jgi:predicted nucleic acid-binding protein
MASRPPSRANRVFIDSSVLIAAAISASGKARDLLLAALRGQVLVYLTDLVFLETERNLIRKAPAALPAYELFRDAFAPTVVNPPTALVLAVAKVVAVKDAPIVAAAIQASSTYLATYNRRHLLQQRATIYQHFAITVATPDEVLRALQA